MRQGLRVVPIFLQLFQSLPAAGTINLVTVILREVVAVIIETAEPKHGVSQPMYSRMKSRSLSLILCGACILAAVASTGCQSSIGGQTLPSAYFLQDDVQFFPPGPEFKLSREAAAQKEARARAQLNQ